MSRQTLFLFLAVMNFVICITMVNLIEDDNIRRATFCIINGAVAFFCFRQAQVDE